MDELKAMYPDALTVLYSPNSALPTIMLSSDSGISYQHLLQSSKTNNHENGGIVGDGSYNIIASGNNSRVNITQTTKAEEEDAELDRMLDGFVSKDALHNYYRSPPCCHPGTRKTVRKEIGKWIDDRSSNKSPLLWLNGPAGVGKSVIAKTIAGSYDQVVASFLFSTSSDRTATTLFPTLARQLARRIPETKLHIVTALKNNSSLLTSEIEEQFDHLIVQPLKKCLTTFTSLPVMVIDGIDECTDESMLLRFLRILVRAGESGNMPLRFIICSRPEPRIHAVLKRIHDDNEETERQSTINPDPLSVSWRPRFWITLPLPDIQAHLYTPMVWGFRNPALLLQEVWKLYRPVQLGVDQGRQPLEIHDDPADKFDRISYYPVISNIQIGFSEECKEDIANYLTDKFDEIRQPRASTCPYLQPCDVADLVERSCGQFLYASTIVRLLDHYHPKDVLEMARHSSLPTPDLNKLYKAILKQAQDEIRNQEQEGGPDYDTELGILKDTLAILIVFEENVHFFNVRENFAVIEGLLGLEKGRLITKLRNMHSVLNIVSGHSISVYHRSFFEFFQSKERSGEHYIAYPNALRRFLVLLGRAGLRYTLMGWRGQLRSDDSRMRGHVESMALACRRNYFKRSSNSMTLVALHDSIHCSLPFLFLLPFRQIMRQFRESLTDASTSSSVLAFVLQFLFFPFLYLFVLSSGSFIISLTIYTLLFDYSIILPLFHPSLHPCFVTMVGILLSSRPLSIMMFIFASLPAVLRPYRKV